MDIKIEIGLKFKNVADKETTMEIKDFDLIKNIIYIKICKPDQHCRTVFSKLDIVQSLFNKGYYLPVL